MRSTKFPIKITITLILCFIINSLYSSPNFQTSNKKNSNELQNLQVHIEKARKHLVNKNYNLLLEELEKAESVVQDQKIKEQINIQKSTVYFLLGDFQQAKSILTFIKDTSSFQSIKEQACSHLYTFLLKKNKLHEYVISLGNSLVLEPNNISTLEELSEIYGAYLPDKNKEFYYLIKLVELKPSKDNLLRISQLYYLFDDVQESVSVCNKLIDLDPENISNYLLRKAYIFSAKGEKNLAINECNEILRIPQSSAQTILRAGYIYRKLGYNNEALIAFKLGEKKAKYLFRKERCRLEACKSIIDLGIPGIATQEIQQLADNAQTENVRKEATDLIEKYHAVFNVADGNKKKFGTKKSQPHKITRVMDTDSTLAQRLPVPYYWQDGAGWCWAASAAMMHKYNFLTIEDFFPGTQLKPWHIAATFNKPKDGKQSAGTNPEILLSLVSIDPLGVYWTQPVFWDIVDVSTIVNNLIQGKPVLGAFQEDLETDGHVIVLCGYSGITENDKVYINDPSGALFKGPNNQRVNIEKTWGEFYNEIDKKPWTLNGWLYYATSLIRVPSGTKASIDLCPSHTPWPSYGIVAKSDNYNQIYLEWDGLSHPGYYYERKYSDTMHPKYIDGGDQDFGDCVISSDYLEFSPIITNCTSTAFDVAVELTIKHNGSTVYTSTTERTLPGYSHLGNTVLFNVPVLNFLVVEDGTYIATLIATVDGVEQDRVSVSFYVMSPQYCNLIISTNTGGTTVPLPGSHLCAVDNIIHVIALPNSGFRLLKWTGDVNSEFRYSDLANIKMDKDKSVSANFCPDCGDVNGDTNISPSDAQAAFDIFLSKYPNPTEWQKENADVNCDGTNSIPRVTPGDAQRIFDKFLGRSKFPCDCSGSWRSSTSLLKNGEMSSNNLIIGSYNLVQEDEIAVPIFIEGPFNLSAFGFDFEFPSESLGFVTVENSSLLSDFQKVGWNTVADGVVRVGGYSTKKIKGNSSELIMTLIFKVSNNKKSSLSFSILNTVDDLEIARDK